MASDIRTSELKTPLDVADYLFRRLHEVGVRGVHGVPGDYNLVQSNELIGCNTMLNLSGCSRLHPQSLSQLGGECERA